MNNSITKQTVAAQTIGAGGKATPCQPNYMAEQARVTLDEAEQAVTLAIKAFLHISLTSQEMAQCVREMMNRSSKKSLPRPSDLALFVDKANAISSSAQEVVVTFQFYDLLRQRLEAIAAYLDTISDSSQAVAARAGKGIPPKENARRTALPSMPVRYTPKRDDQTDITLF